MFASEYAENYLNLPAMLYGDQVYIVPIDKYLNAGITGKNDPKPHPMDYRANRAIAEKDKLLWDIKQDLKIKGHIPPMFEVEGYAFKLLDVVMPFFGKGSPSNLMDVFWLASKYKRVTPGTTRDYSSKYLGLDCNGFAGNFWGINPSTPIEAYDVNRRKEYTDIAAGDAIIFYRSNTNYKPFHIALVDKVIDRPIGNALRFDITQSSGLETGVKTDFKEWNLSKNAKGHVLLKTGGFDAYIVAGPAKGDPRGLQWTVSDA